MSFSQKDWDKVYKEFKEEEDELMVSKNKEYAGEDKLSNFRRVAHMLDTDEKTVCLFWLMKHIDSIRTAIQSGNYRWLWEDESGKEQLKQRIVDARNYLMLLAFCLEEERDA